MSKCLLRGARVVDPANGRDGVFDVLVDGDADRPRRPRPGGRVRRERDRPAERPRRLSRPDRHARAPARAGAGAQGNRRDRHRRGGGRRLHGRRLHAEHDSGERQRRRHRLHPREVVRGEPGARLPDRRGLARAEGRAARGHRRAEGVGLRRRDRRRAPGGDGDADAPRARVHEHVRDAGHRALRGADAQGRRRRARGVSRVGAGAARHSGRGRIDHGAARHRARRADRRHRSTSRT